jgi:hypothetical protein
MVVIYGTSSVVVPVPLQQIPHIAGLCNVSLYTHKQVADLVEFRSFFPGAEFAQPDLVPYPDHF